MLSSLSLFRANVSSFYSLCRDVRCSLSILPVSFDTNAVNPACWLFNSVCRPSTAKTNPVSEWSPTSDNTFSTVSESKLCSHENIRITSYVISWSKGTRPLGPVSRKPRKLYRPVKPFFVYLHLKTEKCVRLKLLV